MNDDAILFYGTKEKFGEFSNFSKFPVFLDQQEWMTSEHYFQAQKFVDPLRREEIRLAKSPMLAAQMGRDRRFSIRSDWDEIKDEVMRRAVLAKFQQHPSLRDLLESTGELLIIEHTKNDSYWGDGGDGSGENMLGKILMEVRDYFRKGMG